MTLALPAARTGIDLFNASGCDTRLAVVWSGLLCLWVWGAHDRCSRWDSL